MDVKTILEQLFFVTAYLEGVAADGKRAATGFIYLVDTDTGSATFLVSNKHVFEGLNDLTVRMVRASPSGEPLLGQATQITINEFSGSAWRGHPDPGVDVAAMPFGPVLEAMNNQHAPPFFRSVSPDLALSPNIAADLDAMEEIIFIGYPSGIFDTANFTPVARRGTTATPVAMNYQGRPAFLIDASVFPGSSGSPVFIANQGSFSPKSGGLTIGSRLILLGVLAAVHTRQVEGKVEDLPARLSVTVEDFLNLGIVFKASAIEDCVDNWLREGDLRRVSTQTSEAPQQPTAADNKLTEAIDDD